MPEFYPWRMLVPSHPMKHLWIDYTFSLSSRFLCVHPILWNLFVLLLHLNYTYLLAHSVYACYIFVCIPSELHSVYACSFLFFFIFLSCLLKFSIRIIYTCRDFIGTLERKYQSKFSIWGITVLATEEVVFIYMTFYYQHVFLLQNSEAKLCQLFVMVVITAYP